MEKNGNRQVKEKTPRLKRKSGCKVKDFLLAKVVADNLNVKANANAKFNFNGARKSGII